MKEQRLKVWENGLIFFLLGAEVTGWILIPLLPERRLLFAGAYLLLLLAYPLSKRQKASISKRETYITVYTRWIILNAAVFLFLCGARLEADWKQLAVRFLVVSLAGGAFLYVLLVINRSYRKHQKKKGGRGLFIYGRKDEENGIPAQLKRRPPVYARGMICNAVSADMALDALEKQIQFHDRIYIMDIPADRRNELLKYCFKWKKPVYSNAKISDIMLQGSEAVKDEDRPILYYDMYRLDLGEAFVKRGFDLIGSALALVVLAPLMGLIALLIKLEDGEAVIYRQTRCTKDGKEFTMYKFRSMIPDSEPDGARLAAAHDERITRIGRILRDTKLDELPQLVNILRGDMSIVGPRPERPELIQDIREEVPEFVFRMNVKAGLTGYAQVQGNYNTLPLDKLKWDLMYIQEYSFVLDLKIILMTPFVIFMKNNRED